MIDWTSNETHIFGDTAALPQLPGHIWLNTSGTVKKKWVALAKTAFLTSAEAVNAHLKVSQQDVWLQPLPNHHVGGLSIWARGFLSGSCVVDYPDVTRKKWEPSHFYQTLVETGASLTSLVPTQLYDLVEKGFSSPKSLRAMLIGGGYLPKRIYKGARQLGWPVIPTYGCTECCSQIATGTVNDPKLKVLPHVSIKIDECLHIKSPALFTAFYDDVLCDPKQDGWYATGDLAVYDQQTLHPLGRLDEQFKVRGEKVALGPLKQILEELSPRIALKAIEDERLGHKLILIAEKGLDGAGVLEEFNKKIPLFARVELIVYVEKLERNALGKVLLQ